MGSLAGAADVHVVFLFAAAVQHQCIPQAILGQDVLCQAKSGMGKTAVFVIAILQQIQVKDTDQDVQSLVLCHTRELAYQVRGLFAPFLDSVRAWGGGSYTLTASLSSRVPAQTLGLQGLLARWAPRRVSGWGAPVASGTQCTHDPALQAQPIS